VRCIDWTCQQPGELCSHTRRHFSLLRSSLYPIVDPEGLHSVIHLKTHLVALLFSFRKAAGSLLFQLVLSAIAPVLLSICVRAFWVQALPFLLWAELDHALQNGWHQWPLCHP